MAVSILEISGPVMIGPSSSHTAGALKLGLFAKAFFGSSTEMIDIFLHGSFATVYKGHATDKAIVAGLLGFAPDSPKIINSFEEAEKQGLQYTWHKKNLGLNVHPNTVRFEMKKPNKTISLQGSSIGGGAVEITKINEFDVSIKETLNGSHPVVFVHKDFPGIVSDITMRFSENKNAISSINSVRKSPNGNALTILELETLPSALELESMQEEFEGIYAIFSLSV